MFESVLLFTLGFTCVTSVYEICKSGKSNKSERVRKSGEKLCKRK